MATYYVDDTKTGGANDGSSPADAWLSILSALTVANDSTIWVADTHAENVTGGTFAITFGAYNLDIISWNGSVYSAGATFSTGSAQDITLSSYGTVRMNGFTFATSKNLNAAGYGRFDFDECRFELTGAAATDGVVSAGSGCPFHLYNCVLKFSHADQRWRWTDGRLRMKKVSIDGAGTKPTHLFFSNGQQNLWEVDSCDFSNIANGGSLGSFTTQYYNSQHSEFFASGILLPANGAVHAITWDSDQDYRVHAYSVATTSGDYRDFLEEDGLGKAQDNRTYYRNATFDGSTGFSVQIDCKAPTHKFIRPFIYELFNDRLAANPTLEFQMVNDGTATINNDEVWLMFEYPNATNSALRDVLLTRMTDYTSTPSALAAGSSSGWVGTGGMTSPQYHKISQALTSSAGVVIASICVAFEGTTPVLYVDPEPTIT